MKTCINLHYLETKEREALRRLHIRDKDLESQVALVQQVSPKLRIYVCGTCPSVGLCRYVNKYGVRNERDR